MNYFQNSLSFKDTHRSLVGPYMIDYFGMANHADWN